MKDNLLTGLVLQGGGALGAYEYGALKALYEQRPGFVPNVITGLSIGSINAAVLAGAENPIATLDKIWREDFEVLASVPFEKAWQAIMPGFIQQNLSSIGVQGMYRLRPQYLLAPLLAPLFTSSLYDTTPLRATLERVIDLDRLNSGSRLVVTSVDVASGKLVRFGNTVSLRQGQPGEFANSERLTLDHILASCSLPPGFPMTKINGRNYWDGGLRSNTPMSEAINCLEAYEPENPSVKREVIMIELVPMEGPVPETLQQVGERFLGLIFSSRFALDQKLFAKTNGYIQLFESIKTLIKVIEKDKRIKAGVDAALAKAGAMSIKQIQESPGYKELNEKRRMDAFTMIPFKAPPTVSQGTDFSEDSIEKRIEAGYAEAIAQNIKEPQWVN